jgi:signal transduction histidine kinase
MSKNKVNRKSRRRSLRRRLQNSLTLSSFLSIGIALVSIMALLFMLISPIGNYFTGSISNKIYKSYVTSTEGMNKYNYIEESFDNSNDDFEINDEVTFEEIMNFAENRNYGLELTDDMDINISELHKRLGYSEENEIIIWGDIVEGTAISDAEKIAIALSSYSALGEADEVLVLSKLFQFDWVNINLSINNEKIFKIPNKIDTEKVNYTNEKFNEINSVIPVVDKYGNKIGELVVSLHTSVLAVIIVPIVMLFLIIAIMTFIIVKILLLPFIYNLLKPIAVLNNELKNIAEYDLVNSCNIKIVQKKPPTEIKNLINYSNTIIGKLQTSYHSLENVNDELEAQNEELDMQKEELEAQNHELMESQQKLKSAQAQLVQSEKLASMGQLTAAIMHEINTPMGAVQSNNQMLDMMLTKLKSEIESKDYEGASKIIGKMVKSNRISVDAANRVNEIIRNLKNFSRIDQAEFQKTDITEGIRSVLVLTSNLWKNKVTVHENYKSLPMINCYSSMINQVFMNIIVNAIQASEKNGNIYIETSYDEKNIYVSIKDEGTGINEKDLAHLFDEGFTTKPEDEGTGLGLSISKDIINKHNGKIEAFNNEDKGSLFKMTLPIEQN